MMAIKKGPRLPWQHNHFWRKFEGTQRDVFARLGHIN